MKGRGLFAALWLTGLFLWTLFVAWTPITIGSWELPDLTTCVWLMLALGVVACANAACTVWAVLLLSAPTIRW